VQPKGHTTPLLSSLVINRNSCCTTLDSMAREVYHSKASKVALSHRLTVEDRVITMDKQDYPIKEETQWVEDFRFTVVYRRSLRRPTCMVLRGRR